MVPRAELTEVVMVYGQYFTHCKRCRKLILLVRCKETGKWIACDPELTRFFPGGGPETFVTPDGRIDHGKLTRGCGETGYRRHRKDCT